MKMEIKMEMKRIQDYLKDIYPLYNYGPKDENISAQQNNKMLSLTKMTNT